jgi:hypothetical protein
VSHLVIDQTIAGKRVIFSRNWFTGRARLSVDGREVTLQNPWNPGTHYSLTLKRSWTGQVGDRTLLIEKIRPILLSGFRPHMYRVLVDGEVVAERRGY